MTVLGFFYNILFVFVFNVYLSIKHPSLWEGLGGLLLPLILSQYLQFLGERDDSVY